MAKSRKTESVEQIVDRANELLAQPELSKEFKEGVIAMLSPILHNTGNYQGFVFIDSHDSDINTKGHVSRIYFKN